MHNTWSKLCINDYNFQVNVILDCVIMTSV